MGIFDRLKQARNFISGGSATLSLDFDKSYYQQGDPISVKINCQVKDRDIFINKVYLQVKAIETVKVKVRNSTSHSQNTSNIHRGSSLERTETETYVSFKMDQQVAPAQALQGGEYYEWESTFELPEEVLPTYIGENAKHVWKAFVGLDTSGNDPDTGWQEFTLYRNLNYIR